MKFNYSNYSIGKVVKFIHCISERKLGQIARETEFVKRKKILEPLTFLKAFSFGAANLKEVTLANIIDYCKDIDPNFNMSKQALDKRLEKGAMFLKKTLEYLFEKYLNDDHNHIEILNSFDDIKIFDSTIIELPDELETTWKGYKGFKGCASKSGLKISCMYSVCTKAFLNMSIFNEVDTDTIFNEIALKNINKNEIAIADLGFFSNNFFKAIMEKHAYFISKVKRNCAYYVEDSSKKNNFRKIDILDLLEKSDGIIDTYLYLGFKKNSRIRCRLVAEALPDKVANARLRKLNAAASQKGETVKKRNKELSRWIIMITNIEPEKLTVKDILNIYRIRWQIELIFKCWKSYAGLKNLKNIGKSYVECILYGKLILILFLYELYSSMNYCYYCINQKELSMIKFFKELNEHYKEICMNLSCRFPQLNNIKNIFKRLIDFSKPEKRKRKTTEEILREISTSSYDHAAAS